MSKKIYGCRKLNRHERDILNTIIVAEEKGKKGFSADDLRDRGYPKQLASLRQKKLIKYHKENKKARRPEYYSGILICSPDI